MIRKEGVKRDMLTGIQKYGLRVQKIQFVPSVQNICPYTNIQRYILEGGGGNGKLSSILKGHFETKK